MATTYGMYAMNFLQIDMDDDGLFVDVPGMSENWFKVRVDESGLVPVATHCKCSHFAHKGTCLHAEIVNAFYSKLYASNIAKASEKSIEQAMDASDELEAVYEEVAFSEQIIATEGLENFSTVKKVQKVAASSKLAPRIAKKGNKLVKAVAKITDISKKGNLNTSRAFQLMR